MTFCRETDFYLVRFQIWSLAQIACVILIVILSTLSASPVFDYNLKPVSPNATNPFDVQLKPRRLKHQSSIEQVISIVITVLISADILLRITATPTLAQYCKSFMNFVDVAFLVISYLFVALNSTYAKHTWKEVIYPAVRMGASFINLLRLFRMAKFCLGIRTLLLTLKASFAELSTLSAFLFISVSIFGNLIYFLNIMNPTSPFSDVPISSWWAIVTMTTVGYGDVVPTTTMGRIVGAFCAVVGLILAGLTIPILSKNFDCFYENEKMLASRRLLFKRQTCNAETQASD